MDMVEKCKEIATDIYKELGNEQDEVTYQNAFEVAFILDKVKYEREKDMPIYYRGIIVGRGNADFVVYDEMPLVIEIKAVAPQGLDQQDISQTRNYMKSLGICPGVLINFPQTSRKGSAQDIEVMEC